MTSSSGSTDFAMIGLAKRIDQLPRLLLADLDLDARLNQHPGWDRKHRFELALLPAKHPGKNDALRAVLVGLRDPEDGRALLLGAALVGQGAGHGPVVIDNGLGAADFCRLGRRRLVGRLSGLANNGRRRKAEDRQGERRQKTLHRSHSERTPRFLALLGPTIVSCQFEALRRSIAVEEPKPREAIDAETMGSFKANRQQDARLTTRIWPADANLDLPGRPWLSPAGRRRHSSFPGDCAVDFAGFYLDLSPVTEPAETMRKPLMNPGG